MKKSLAVLLIISLICSFCACTDANVQIGNENDQTDPSSSVIAPTQPSMGEPSDKPSKPVETKPGATDPTNPTKPGMGPSLENDIHNKLSYTDKDDMLKFYRDDVVGSFGDVQLTNAKLQIYYWSEVYGFLNNYYYYLSYLGLDYTKPLDTQACAFDKTLTWQQYFLDSAISVWKSNTALAELARENAFVLPEKYQKELDGLYETMQAQADKGKYESVDAMLQDSFGDCVTFTDYYAHMEVYYMGYAYFEARCAEIAPTVEEIEAYYAANEEKLVQSGIKKDGSYTIDVRHILVLINNVASEMGGGTITEDHWTACQAAAQKIYDEYLAGEQTENRFGELANQHSDDQGGNVTNGGLYSNVKPGDMVKEFNDWCFDENRQIGDTGLVKTQYGYHVMYFAGREEAWISKTRDALISEEASKIVEEAVGMEILQIEYSKILLGEVEL